ncbi:MAG: PIN domain-containing protein [Defluviitaleaceae bacterium]|nr:PIN domain-containing protein [Defluviitaleaceae bacterium]MCL2238461.1 PIN domain-containing protein [Defluviitaleaceae bacterium]
MHGAKAFIDTNILVYAFTADEPVKREKALAFLDERPCVISTQVLKEFTYVLLKKSQVKPKAIGKIVHEISEVATVVNEEAALILAAVEIYKRYGYVFYDSLIIATALHNGCTMLASEDMQEGQIVAGTLEIVNPLSDR